MTQYVLIHMYKQISNVCQVNNVNVLNVITITIVFFFQFVVFDVNFFFFFGSTRLRNTYSYRDIYLNVQITRFYSFYNTLLLFI